MGDEQTVRLHPVPADARAGMAFCGRCAAAGLALAASSFLVGDRYALILLGGGPLIALAFGAVAALCSLSPSPGRSYLDLGPEGFVEWGAFGRRAHRWRDIDGFRVVDDSEGGPLVAFRLSGGYAGRRPRGILGMEASHDGFLTDTYGLSARALAERLNARLGGLGDRPGSAQTAELARTSRDQAAYPTSPA